jgi:acetyl esterase/lipase
MVPPLPSSNGRDVKLLTVEDVMRLPSPPPDHRFAYGPDPNQFGELRLPKTRGPHPVAVVIHGGCWRAEYDLNHISSFSAALAREGIAAWTFDYRRVGQSGGGWPGTFEDIAHGAASLRLRARRFDLNLNRVVAVGHSAGGQLALWLASHRRAQKPSPLSALNPLPLRGLVILAGITDLRRAAQAGICGEALRKLLGGGPETFPDRYRSVSPIELLPLGVAQHLIHGGLDSIVPISMSEKFVETSRRLGDQAQLTVLPEAGHFEPIVPETLASQEVIAHIKLLLGE